ncbi:hypothetical protein VNI00_015074 [Paramarasmius palmivorus]|uniref:Uncharacterized protein n=1 Tax=Paramarasmius palmivorus TaxID=297713 RepID=A0AAW0BPE3_9AGAR
MGAGDCIDDLDRDMEWEQKECGGPEPPINQTIIVGTSIQKRMPCVTKATSDSVRMASAADIQPFTLSASIDLEPLVQLAFTNQDAVDPIFSESPLSSPPHSPLPPNFSDSSTSTPLPGPSSIAETTQAQSRSKQRSKELRKRKREAEKEDATAYEPPPPTKRRHIEPGIERCQVVQLDVSRFRASGNGFTGHHSRTGYQPGEYTLREMVGPNSRFKFNLLQWNGSFTLPIVDQTRRIWVICISNPRDKEWGAVTTRAADKLMKLRSRVAFTTKQKSGSRRGQLFTLNTGVVNGLGLKAPITRKQANKKSSAVVDELLADADFRRIAGHGSGAFRTWQENIWQSYAQNKKDLQAHDASLCWNYNNSIFAAAAFNFGPRVVSLDHVDFENRPDGFCAVTALCPSEGGYDYKTGGHLILWDLHLVVEFPPGTTILLPSAILRHSNVSIGANEHRMSFAQYSSGHLFRFVERGFRTEEDFFASLTPRDRKYEEERDGRRWKESLNNFATLDDVLNDRM